MPVDAKLRAMLVCPKCRGSLVDAKDEKGVAEGLKCDACKVIYPVKEDIPVMIYDEATKL